MFSHAQTLALEAFVYVLTNDGSVLLTKGGHGFLKNHFFEQLPTGGWDIGALPLPLNIDGVDNISGILCSKRVALGLRELTGSILKGVANEFK